MMDGDHFFSHGNLFDYRAHDFLFFCAIHLLHVFIQPSEKAFHPVAQLDPALVFHRSHLQVLLLFLQAADFHFQFWNAFS